MAGIRQLPPFRVDRRVALDEEFELDTRAAARRLTVRVVPGERGRPDDAVAPADVDDEAGSAVRIGRELDAEPAVERERPRQSSTRTTTIVKRGAIIGPP